MKNLLLNCDQVFDALTRGPFPSGDASDEGVEHHLRACHECRRLAEALRPAVELLHEAVDRTEALELPEYHGTLPLARPLAAVAKPAPPLARRPARRFDQAVSAIRVVAASLLLAALGVLAYGYAVSPAGNRGDADFSRLLGGRAVPAHLPDGPALVSLASLKLPARCLPAKYESLTADQARALAAAMASGAEDALRCCTECHAAAKPFTANANLVAVVAQNCVLCHRG